ncbi:MAG: hypothetical protein P4M12_06370 [Gammaproteobacteria bacterium]|nr:hypothetical protein [Gammaproteobacteria bacterium]
MSAYLVLIVAGVVFAIVAFMHLLRLIYKAEVTVAGKIIPLWVSVLGFLFPLCLSIWIFITILF